MTPERIREIAEAHSCNDMSIIEDHIHAIKQALDERDAEIVEMNTDLLMKFAHKSYDIKQIILARICLDINVELATKIQESKG